MDSYLRFPMEIGIDGLSLGSILLTGFITTLATLAAWPVIAIFFFLRREIFVFQDKQPLSHQHLDFARCLR